MSEAPVSVVIPAYNCGAFIVDAIESVLAQTRRPRQVIVIDDGSSDDTALRLSPYADRIEYVFQANAGVSAARNRGVALAHQPFVAFLDADDVWHPRKIALQLAAFEQRPQLGILSSPDFDWPGEGMKRQIDPTAALPVSDITWADMAVKNRMNTSAVIARRKVLELAGSFDGSLQGPEDRDLWLRVVEIAPAAVLQIPLSGYRIRREGISRAADRCSDGMRRILRKIDQRGLWRGRALLRCKAYSYMNHSCAYLYSSSGQLGVALKCSLKSLAWYPFPYSRRDVQIPLERLRRLAVILLRLLHIKPREIQPTHQPDLATQPPGA